MLHSSGSGNNCNRGYTKEVPPFNVILLEDQKIEFSIFKKYYIETRAHYTSKQLVVEATSIANFITIYTKFMARFECGGNHYLCTFVMCCPL
jgi:hypothetical protein